MTSFSELCVCPECGSESLYTVVTSCNSFMMDMLPTNKCTCGYQLTEEDVDISKCSPFFRGYRRIGLISKRFNELYPENSDFKCEKCGCTDVKSHSSMLYFKKPDKYKDDEDVDTHCSFSTCKNCGHEQPEPLEYYLDLYDFIENGDKRGEFILRKKSNYSEIVNDYNENRKKIRSDIENQLIREGVLLTREQEQEYDNKYHEEMRRLIEG